MTRQEYAAIRRSLGPQDRVGRALDVHPTTLSKRENGKLPVTQEAALALIYLSEHPELVGS